MGAKKIRIASAANRKIELEKSEHGNLMMSVVMDHGWTMAKPGGIGSCRWFKQVGHYHLCVTLEDAFLFEVYAEKKRKGKL